jgi:hypothetical protein
MISMTAIMFAAKRPSGTWPRPAFERHLGLDTSLSTRFYNRSFQAIDGKVGPLTIGSGTTKSQGSLP